MIYGILLLQGLRRGFGRSSSEVPTNGIYLSSNGILNILLIKPTEMWMFAFIFIRSRQSLLVIHQSRNYNYFNSFTHHILANVACGSNGLLSIHHYEISSYSLKKFMHALVTHSNNNRSIDSFIHLFCSDGSNKFSKFVTRHALNDCSNRKI